MSIYRLSFVVALVAFALLIALPTAAMADAGQSKEGQDTTFRRQEPPTITIRRIAAPPRLDDFVAGRIPGDMTKVTGFLQREPRDGEPASRETVGYLGYDDRNLYAVFVCKEDPGTVRAHMGKRESIMGDDIVGVLVDTFHDHRHVYEFLVNPLGIQMDATSEEGQNDDYSFDTLWHSDGRLTPEGYVVLVAVPFRSIRFADLPAQEWGVSLLRSIPSRNEMSFWPYMTRKVATFADQLATLRGMERISPGRNLQFIPYGAFTGSRYLDQNNAAYARKNDGRAGLDAKMVVKDALTFDVALNPDFSQVESDEPQVTINQRFEVMFPEKRPFFLENAGYFKTPEDLFFSRRIVDPRAGGRVTGQIGKWNVGGLVMDDRAAGENVEATSTLYGQSALVAVGRVTREFAKQSTVGVLLTDREFGSTFNRVASVDTRLRLNDNWIANAQAVTSDTRDDNAASLSGQAFYGSLSYNTRTLRFASAWLDRDPGFRSQVGFIPRTDMREWNNEFGYTIFPKGKKILSWGPSIEQRILWDHEQRLQEWEVGPEFEIEMPAGTNVNLFADRSYELYEGLGFDKHSIGFWSASDWFKWLGANASYHRGTGINYYPAPGLVPFLGDTTELEGGLTLKPTPQLRLEETYIYESLSTRADSLQGWPAGASVFRLQMTRTKVNYQFTRALSLRAILDYNIVHPNPQLVTLDRDKNLTLDVLATYMVNPWTALYVGVTDAYANLRLDPMVSPAFARTDSATTSIGRQFFVKMSYLLRF